MIGHICSAVETTDPAVPSDLPTARGSRENAASLDQELIALSQNFQAKLSEWVKQIGRHGIESYDEKAEPGRSLHALRVEWGGSLAALRSLAPRTVAGATEKISAAQVFLTFSCEADGSAAELLALATRELGHVTANLHGPDRAHTSRPVNTQRPLGWFERLTRRA